jgi:hypothetical protein
MPPAGSVRGTVQLEAGDARGQEVDRDPRTKGVEAPGLDRREPGKRRCVRGQQQGIARRGARRSGCANVQDARDSRDETSDHKAGETDPVDFEAAEARDLCTFTQPALSMGGATSAERLKTLVPVAAKRIHQSGRQADD